MLARDGNKVSEIQGTIMAVNGDMKQADGSYSGFTVMMKWGTIASAIVVAFVIWLIA